MKKTIIIILLLILSLLNVKAANLEMDYINNPYYYRVWENTTDTGKLTFYNLDGKVVYCVEPGAHITDNTYFEVSSDVLGLSNEILNNIKLIGYYGYEYPGHDTVNYKIATQALIWEKLRNLSVTFWTGRDKTGDEVNVNNEKNEILRLINKHYLNPNIDNLTISKDTDYMIIDSNNVLENYEIIDNDNLDVSISGNKLHINGDVGDYQITLKKRKYDNETSIVYMGSDGISQKMMKLRLDEDKYYKINIHIVGGKINLQKLDYNTKTNTTIGSSSLENAKYGIYDQDDNLVETIITNNFGEAESNLLKLGTYYVKEITSSYGYELDTNTYEVNLNVDNLESKLKVYEKLRENKITLIKTVEGDSSLLDGEENITFEIYFKDNMELYKTVTTNEDGVVSFSLPYGNYIIHQVNTNSGYLKCEDFELVVNELKEEVYKVVYDKRVGNLKIIKVDSKTNLPLSNALFELYDINNNLKAQGCTNKEGILEFNNLLFDKYKVIERVAPKGYSLNTNEYIIYNLWTSWF